jgi:hypothetical protein
MTNPIRRLTPRRTNLKTIRFIFTTIAVGALTLGLGLAGETSDQAREPALSEHEAKTTSDRPPGAGHGVQPRAARERADGKHLEDQRDEGPASGKSSRTSGTKPIAKHHAGPNLSQRLQGNGEHPGEKLANNAQIKSRSGNAAGLPQHGSDKSAGVAKAGSTSNKMENYRGLPVAGLSTPPPPNAVVRRRGPGPAIIGGSANSSTMNTAVINGTGMRRKP